MDSFLKEHLDVIDEIIQKRSVRAKIEVLLSLDKRIAGLSSRAVANVIDEMLHDLQTELDTGR